MTSPPSKFEPLHPGEADRRRSMRAWCLYDWANSAFATSALTAIMPSYFAQVAHREIPAHLATAFWGYASAAGLALAALAGPLLGAASDHLKRRKLILFILVLLGSLGTVALGGVGSASWRLMLLLFALAFIAFASANVLYDSFLPEVAEPGQRHRVSARGFAYGYLGGGLMLAVNLAWIIAPRRFGLPDVEAAVRLSLASVGVWWLGFSLPLFLWVPEGRHGESGGAWREVAGAVFHRLRRTVRDVRDRPELFRFLLAFWLYSDGIGTIIKMATIYGSELGIPRQHLLGALLLVQLVAAPATLGFSRLAQLWGARLAICAGLLGYAVVAVLACFLTRTWQYWGIALLVALLQGGTQALSRSLFASLVPRGREAEMFGFYSVSEKFAGMFGPLLFGVIAQALGTSRLAVLSLLPMFLIGAWLLLQVHVPEAAVGRSPGSKEAGEAFRP